MSDEDQFTLHHGAVHDLNNKAESAFGSDDERHDSTCEATADVVNERDVGTEKAQQLAEKAKTDGSGESEQDPKLVR